MPEFVIFKSKPEYYIKEKMGIKSNTVRLINYNDERFKKLLNWTVDQDMWITIVNPEKEYQLFNRRISDVSILKDYMIISWFHYHYIYR